MKRGRPPQSEARDTRQALLDAALELFAAKGYFGTTLREIASAVGVQDSALYHYFESKEALFDAMLASTAPQGLSAMKELIERRPRVARTMLIELATLAIRHFSTLRERRLYRILMSDGFRLANEGKINLLEKSNAFTRVVEQLFASLVDEGLLRAVPPDVLALEFFGPLTVWRHIQVAQPKHRLVVHSDRFIEAHVEHFLHGAGSNAKRR